MSSKIKVDTIENVAGSGNVSLGSGHNLVVPGNITGQGTLGVTGTSTLATTNISGNITQTKSDTALAHFKTTATNTYSEVLIEDGNAGYAWQTRSDNAQSTSNGDFLLNDRRGTFPIIIEENNPTNTLKLSNGYPLFSKKPMFQMTGAGAHSVAGTGYFTYTSANIFGQSPTEYDPDSLFNVSNGRFTAPVAGRYFFIFSIGISFSSGYHYTYIRKNGSDVSGLSRNIDQENDYSPQVIQGILNLAANDYVTAERNNNNVSGAVTGAQFCGFLLG